MIREKMHSSRRAFITFVGFLLLAFLLIGGYVWYARARPRPMNYLDGLPAWPSLLTHSKISRKSDPDHYDDMTMNVYMEHEYT